ncbi:MAG: 4Fe-4S dicluster domain-containing protein [Planctomycetes bacterium]|nr:4Fe-4S dicluster domain-containing protein [Planctomycetota bacterium]
MDLLFLSSGAFHRWLDDLSRENEVLALRPGEGPSAPIPRFARWPFDGGGEPEMGGVRAAEALRFFLLPARERIARGADPNARPRAIVGVKACDLASLPILDSVFRDGHPSDPAYVRAREETILIAADCTTSLETCFCTSLGRSPFPEKGFDWCLTAVGGGCVVEVGSERGAALAEQFASHLKPADPRAIQERNDLRERVTGEIRQRAASFGIPSREEIVERMERARHADFWERHAATCVECGNCNFSCPTCHCFLLSGEGWERIRLWDSCLLESFARVAGGGNPRPHLAERLRNRFEKKFWFFPGRTGEVACTGCGRCYEGCLGKIDIRRVLRSVADV